MTEATDVALQPSREQIAAHLDHLFSDQLSGMVEIAWTNPVSGALDEAQLFDVGDLDQAVDCAVQKNSVPGQSVYVGAALRKPGTFPVGRAKDADYHVTVAAYVDLDDPGTPDAAKILYGACKPTLAVITGRHPEKRAQLWWKLEQPLADAEAHKAQIKSITVALSGDPSVINPSRVMRLGGTVAWPSPRKTGRIAEMTELLIPKDSRPRVIVPGHLETVFPPDMFSVQTHPANTTMAVHDFNQLPAGPERSPISGKLSSEYLMNEIRGGRLWHVNVNKLVGHWLMKGWTDVEILATAPSLTLPGWTIDQTIKEMRQSIEGGRRKWEKPQEAVQFDPETGEIYEDEFNADDDGPGPIQASTFPGQAPPREWIVQDWLPARTVTALYGDGGIGKTLLAQQLASSYASGGIWCGMQMPRGVALCVFCEDDREEIWRRQNAIDRAAGIGGNHSMTDLHLWPRVGFDSVLENFDRDGIGKTTAFYARLESEIQRLRPGLLILDTAADLYGGNEIIRNQVNQFVKAALGKFVVKYGLSIVLLAHPSLSGLASGTGTSGSTAWNNSVRSRWYLEKPEGGLPQQRILTRKKANYASSGNDQAIQLIWENGILCTISSPDAVDKIEMRTLKQLVCDAIFNAWEAGVPLGTGRSSRPVKDILPRLVTNHPPAMALRAFAELERDGYVSSQHGNTHKRGYKLMRILKTGEMVNDTLRED